MVEEESWLGRSGRQVDITNDQLADLKQAVGEFLESYKFLVDAIRPQDRAAMLRRYMVISGTIPSGGGVPGGLFRMLDVLIPQTVGADETQWFRDISRLGRAAMNSVLGLEEGDMERGADFQDRIPSDPRILVAFSRMSRACGTIDGILPPTAELGKGKGGG